MSGSGFHTTHWSVIQRTTASDAEVRGEALRDLCEAYWYPLYAYLRRLGRDADRAGDIVQGLFVKLLEKDGLSRVTEEGGTFRQWLITCLRNHERDVLEHEGALRRGGGVQTFSIDVEEGERRYGAEPSHGADPEASFERAWARQVLDNALEILKGEYQAGGRGPVFDQLQGALKTDHEELDREQVGQALGLSPVAVRVALHRLRERYRSAILGEVRSTLGDGVDPGEELRSLLLALEGGS
jgi:RNA polymerase sigma-70 factor (ECF subfamily)